MLRYRCLLLALPCSGLFRSFGSHGGSHLDIARLSRHPPLGDTNASSARYQSREYSDGQYSVDGRDPARGSDHVVVKFSPGTRLPRGKAEHDRGRDSRTADPECAVMRVIPDYENDCALNREMGGQRDERDPNHS